MMRDAPAGLRNWLSVRNAPVPPTVAPEPGEVRKANEKASPFEVERDTAPATPSPNGLLPMWKVPDVTSGANETAAPSDGQNTMSTRLTSISPARETKCRSM